MTRTIALLAAIAFWVVGSVYAEYTFSQKGEWPHTWPKELEPLRKQATTYEGPIGSSLHYGIPFTKREDLEAAWPHLLKVKGKGAGIHLVRGGNFFLGGGTAGVVVHALEGKEPVYLEVVVDGNIVDLNRLALPPDTPITDERFKAAKK